MPTRQNASFVTACPGSLTRALFYDNQHGVSNASRTEILCSYFEWITENFHLGCFHIFRRLMSEFVGTCMNILLKYVGSCAATNVVRSAHEKCANESKSCVFAYEEILVRACMA